MVLPQPVFIPRPIPNLKVRRTSAQSQSTTSTATPDDLFLSNNSDSTSNYGLQSVQYHTSHTNYTAYHNTHHQPPPSAYSTSHSTPHGGYPPNSHHHNNSTYTHGNNGNAGQFPSRSTTSSDSSDLDDRRRERSSKLGFNYYQPHIQHHRVAYPSLWTPKTMSQQQQQQKLPSSRGKELLCYSASKTSSPSHSLKYESFRMPRDDRFTARKDRQPCIPPRIQPGKLDRSSCAAVNCLH